MLSTYPPTHLRIASFLTTPASAVPCLALQVPLPRTEETILFLPFSWLGDVPLSGTWHTRGEWRWLLPHNVYRLPVCVLEEARRSACKSR